MNNLYAYTYQIEGRSLVFYVVAPNNQLADAVWRESARAFKVESNLTRFEWLGEVKVVEVR